MADERLPRDRMLGHCRWHGPVAKMTMNVYGERQHWRHQWCPVCFGERMAREFPIEEVQEPSRLPEVDPALPA